MLYGIFTISFTLINDYLGLNLINVIIIKYVLVKLYYNLRKFKASYFDGLFQI